MRIDKFLWCVRLCKSRSLATEECAKGRVRIGDPASANGAHEIKASTAIKPGDLFSVRQPPIWRVYQVLAIPASRVGAKLVETLIADRTPWEDLEKQETARKVRSEDREVGTGRPSKKDRRDIERFRPE